MDLEWGKCELGKVILYFSYEGPNVIGGKYSIVFILPVTYEV